MTKKSGYYGYVAGMATAAALQPLDNIKMALIVPPHQLSLSSNFMRNVCLAVEYLRV
jgi:hypothetical protein